MCAIVAARIRDGAVSSLDSPHSPPSLLASAPTSEVFHSAAISSIPRNLSSAKEFDYRRAKALLGILCVQYADIVNLHTHLGDYFTLSLGTGFYDEERWPQDLTEPEIQEWRRLVSKPQDVRAELKRRSFGPRIPWKSLQRYLGVGSSDIDSRKPTYRIRQR